MEKYKDSNGIKSILIFSLLILYKICNATSNIIYIDNLQPENIVNVQTLIPKAQFDIRYSTAHNFVGKKINGYNAPKCLLTKEAANALKQVENKLLLMGLTLKIYDCYRPQMAVDDFAIWATKIDQTQMKTEFYPKVDKKNLFKDEYIAYRSGHSRGSTIDLTIVPINSEIPTYTNKQVDCTTEYSKRVPDNSLDFGTGFDCFSPVSHPDYMDISPQARANRLLLQTLMSLAGFQGIKEEWWHFTLKNEPYPDTYFNFMIDK